MVKVKKSVNKVTKKPSNTTKTELNKVKKTAKLSRVRSAAKNTTRKVKRQLIKKQKKDTYLKKICEDRGVVYVKHIPHGFYEKEMFDYFKQFGKVTAIRLPRSKNGRSKGFAFIEFEYKEIAKVVADTMNNYLMFGKLLKTEYIPPDKQKPHMFHRGTMPWDDSTYKEVTNQRRELDRINKNKPILDAAEFAKKTKKCVEKIHRKLNLKTRVDYDFQINEGDNDKVKLVSVKSPESPSSSKCNKSKVNSKNTKKVQKQLSNTQLDESDNDIVLKPPPNVITKLLKTSKSKMKTIKNKTNVVKDKLKTEAKTNKKVNDLKTKIKRVKDLNSNKIKKVKDKVKKAVRSNNRSTKKSNNSKKAKLTTKKVVQKVQRKVKK